MATARDRIRYRKNNAAANSILRLALLRAWGSHCYWCGDKREYTEVQIDHIIPESVPDTTKNELVEEFLGADRVGTFDVDDVYNLGPMCPTCNREKSDRLFQKVPRFMAILQQSGMKAAEVKRFVQSYESAGRVAKALAAVVKADLEDSRSLHALTEFAPLLESRLRRLEFTSTEEVEDPLSDARELTVVQLDHTGRRARDAIEVLTGLDFDEAIEEPIENLKSEITDRLRSDILATLDSEQHLEPDVSLTVRIDLVITDLHYIVDEQHFKMAGTYDAEASGQAAVMSDDGDGLDYLQRDAYSYGDFGSFFSCHAEMVTSGLTQIWRNDGVTPPLRSRKRQQG